jgi:glutathione S-transferase
MPNNVRRDTIPAIEPGQRLIELYYSRYSINSEKVLLCLFEKNIDFVGHQVDLFRFEQTSPSYLRINPLGLVPALLVDGASIPESTVINEYIEDAFPENPLRPRDAIARARMRVWVQHFQDSFYPPMAILSQARSFADVLKRRWSRDELEAMIQRKPNADRRARQLRAVREGLTPDEVANAERNAEEMLDRMEAQLAFGAEWLVDALSLADFAALPNVHRFFLLGLERMLERRPRVLAWYRRMQQRPSFRRTYEFAPVFANAE